MYRWVMLPRTGWLISSQCSWRHEPSGVLAAAVALGAGEIRTASLAAGRRGGAGLLKLSLQAFGQPLQFAARSCLTLPVGAHPLGAGLCHFPSVAASNVTR